MTGKPNFILVPDTDDKGAGATRSSVPSVERVRGLIASAAAAILPFRWTAPVMIVPDSVAQLPSRPRLVFGFDATASREPAWKTAREVTDALVRVLPGELDVALAVHGGSALHTFTEFTSNPNTLRDRAASITCRAGSTRLQAILQRALAAPGVRVVTYIGDVYEESPNRGRRLADEMGRRGIRLFVMHDVADWTARRDAEVFLDLARRTGGCVLPFDASAPDRLRDLLAAVAVYAVGGAQLLQEKRRDLPGAVVLLEHLDGGG
jgi:hypothetical protein